MTSNPLPVQVPVPPSASMEDILHTWMEDLISKNRILEEENKCLKSENQRLMTEMEKMSLDLKKSEEELLSERMLRKIKTEPLETDGNIMFDNGSALPRHPSGQINPHMQLNFQPIHAANAALNERQNHGQERIVFTCRNCKKHLQTRHECIVCNDFNLCVGCYGQIGHPHRMFKIIDELEIESDSPSSPVSTGNVNQSNSAEVTKLSVSIQTHIENLAHASQCKTPYCQLPSCQKMKRVFAHANICKKKSGGGCPVCKQLTSLCCYHSKRCAEDKCPIPFCAIVKRKMRGNVVKQSNPLDPNERHLSVQRCIKNFVHSCQCKIADCRQPSCQKMKRVVAHAKICKRKTIGGCPICKQLTALCCYHGKRCVEVKCPIPFCAIVKRKIRQLRL